MDIPSLVDLNLTAALPMITLGFGAMILVLVDLFLPDERKTWTPWLAMAGLAVSAVLVVLTANTAEPHAFGGLYVVDGFASVMSLIALGTAFLSILLSMDYIQRTGTPHGEYYALMLFSVTGVMLMVGAADLVIVFIALELLSIPLYLLAAFRTTQKTRGTAVTKSEEAGMKYFILGAFASAFFVYGAALVYGATGTTRLAEIFSQLASIDLASNATGALLVLAGGALIIVGMAFKVALVPFHMWTPDVYEGAPTPVTAYMSIAAKVGGFAALLRILVISLTALELSSGEAAVWQTAAAVLAGVTIIFGNLVAIAQTDMKRMLAYSSIAHAGYMMIAVAAAGTPGYADSAVQAMMVYLVAYLFTNVGAFGVVSALERDDGTGTSIESYAGLAQRRPFMAVAMAIFMLSLTGIPLTAGFVGKLLVFSVAVQAGLAALAVIGVLMSVVSAFYYVRVIVNMYLLDESSPESEPLVGTEAVSRPSQWAVTLSLVGTLVFGIVAPLGLGLLASITLVI
jgi:NADH-quinone oxidoreductase subunit N